MRGLGMFLKAPSSGDARVMYKAANMLRVANLYFLRRVRQAWPVSSKPQPVSLYAGRISSHLHSSVQRQTTCTDFQWTQGELSRSGLRMCRNPDLSQRKPQALSAATAAGITLLLSRSGSRSMKTYPPSWKSRMCVPIFATAMRLVCRTIFCPPG